jgi:hypothetical protein
LLGGTLRATGGALVPKKSYWYAIDFLWDGNAWKYRNKEEMPGDILISGVDGKKEILKMHEPLVGQETLGVIQAMDGNNKAEITHLCNKAKDFPKTMRTGFLSKSDA